MSSSAEISDLGDYLSECNWLDLVSTSIVEDADEVFHLHQGGAHQYVFRLYVDESTDVVALSSDLSSLSFLDYAQPNAYWTGLEPASSPNDPGIIDPETSQVYDFYSHAGLLDAWDVTRGTYLSGPDVGTGVVIGSLEGIFDSTPDLSPNIFVHSGETNGNSIDDDNNGWVDDKYGLQTATQGASHHHATITSTVAVAEYNNSVGIAGVAGEAKLLGAGQVPLVNAVEYLVAHHARSAFNFTANKGSAFSAAEQDALRCAIENELLLVYSGTNDETATERPDYGSDLVLLVAGTKDDGSNYFQYGPYVDIVGQAQDIPISRENGDYVVADKGMSYVMPQLAGLAALIWSVWPEYSTEQVVARMLGTASTTYLASSAIDLLNDGHYGAGRYDAGAAVDDTVDIAPPTFDRDLVRFNDSTFGDSVDEPLENIWLFSKQLFSIASFTDASNWELLFAGADDDFDASGDNVQIAIAPMSTYSIGSRWASIDIKGEMPNGRYRLTGDASGLQDPFGTPLDGDGDGDSDTNDDFVYEFDYTGHREQPEPLTQTVFVDSKAPMTVGIRLSLGEDFELNKVMNRGANQSAFESSVGLNVPYSWTLDVDWGDENESHMEYTASTWGAPVEMSDILAHHYDDPDTYTIVFTITGAEALGSTATEVDVVIDGHMATVAHAGGVKDVILWGSENDDSIVMDGDSESLSILVHDDETPVSLVSTFLSGVDGQIAVFGYAGDDSIDAANVHGVSIEAHGGLGDDTVIGGTGNDTLGGFVSLDSVLSEFGNDYLSGGDGDDYIEESGGVTASTQTTARNYLRGEGGNDHLVMWGGLNLGAGMAGDDVFEVYNGRSFLVGGTGSDSFYEHTIGEHLIITGEVDLDGFDEEMDVVQEWLYETGHSFAARVANLSGTGSTYGGEAFLVAGETVLDDGVPDYIYNSKVEVPFLSIYPKSWYFVGFKDDEYWSTNVPFTGEKFSNISPAAFTVDSWALSNEEISLTLNAGAAERHYMSNNTEQIVALTASSYGYSYQIDWNGDGTFEDTVAGGANVEASHEYGSGHAHEVRIRTVSAGMSDGPQNNILFVDGTDNADLLEVNWDSQTQTTVVKFNSTTIKSTTTSLDNLVVWGRGGDDGIIPERTAFDQSVLVDGGDGNDTIKIEMSSSGGSHTLLGGAGNDFLIFEDGYNTRLSMSGGVGDDILILTGGDNITALLDGGDDDDWILDLSWSPTTITALGGAGDDILLGGVGADSLDGGSGNDLIVGGYDVEMDGDDTLLGGDGNDVLIGSGGADSMIGGAGEDILISGSLTTDFFGEEETPGVLQVWRQWLISDTFTHRIEYISGVLEDPQFLDESFLFQSDGSTFLDDAAVDTLLGGADNDWFIYHFGQDDLVDLSTGDVEWEIAPE